MGKWSSLDFSGSGLIRFTPIRDRSPPSGRRSMCEKGQCERDILCRSLWSLRRPRGKEGADSHPSRQPMKKWGLSPITTRNWSLPTTWTLPRSLKKVTQTWLMPRFQLMRPRAENRATPRSDFWPAELWTDKRVLLQAAQFLRICHAVIENNMRAKSTF